MLMWETASQSAESHRIFLWFLRTQKSDRWSSDQRHQAFFKLMFPRSKSESLRDVSLNRISDTLSYAVCAKTVGKSVTYSTICLLGEEPVKLSIEVPEQRFCLTFTFLPETVSGLIIRIPLIRTKITLLWDFN